MNLATEASSIDNAVVIVSLGGAVGDIRCRLLIPITGLEILSAMTGCCRSNVQLNDARKEAKIVETISNLIRPDLRRGSFLVAARLSHVYPSLLNSHLDSALKCGVSIRKLGKL